jgi:hypothetical protein
MVLTTEAAANAGEHVVANSALKDLDLLDGALLNFTKAQKEEVLALNRLKNGGVVRSAVNGEILIRPQKSQKGVTPPRNEWQVDHIIPRSKGGADSVENAQILSREENRRKSNKL